MNFRYALVAATVLALPLAANAQPITGLYIGGNLGANIMPDENTTVSSGRHSASGNVTTNIGPAVDLSIGYGLGNGIRAEIEGNYMNNPFNGGSGGGLGASGREQKYGVFGNVLYDFVGLSPYVQPYIGAGVGYESATDSELAVTGPGFRSLSPTTSQGSFAYQGIAGLAFPIAAAPGLSLTADYRFMGLAGSRTYSAAVNGAPGANKFNQDYNNIVTVGFIYALGGHASAAPMAPMAAAVPPSPVSRSYLVFFDWDKADLTDRARQIVSEAASNSTKVQYTRLEVNGYTDTSGTPQYNQGLSVRRAQAVAAELVKDGVPKSAISIQGFGETHPLVPTGQGVREPQNRRVEIIIK